MTRGVIEIRSRCGHYQRCTFGIVARVVAGEIASDTVIPCPDCGRVCFSVLEQEIDLEETEEERTCRS